jgi:predicted transcriptional regulator
VGVASERRGIAITKLMNSSMVSYRQLTRHLQVLLNHSLLEYDEQKKVYKITSKGLQFLELYTKMAEMLKPIT